MHAKKWKEAWPILADAVRQESLEKFGPFPSLYGNDLVHTLRDKGVDETALMFVAELKRELSWAYDNWSKCALTPDAFLKDLTASVGELTPGAQEFHNIIQNYRMTHNIPDPDKGYMNDIAAKLAEAVSFTEAAEKMLADRKAKVSE